MLLHLSEEINEDLSPSGLHRSEFLSLPGHGTECLGDSGEDSQGNNPRASHQCCRIKLGHDVVQENSQVSWAGFQELDVLEAAALPINLQGYRELHRNYSGMRERTAKIIQSKYAKAHTAVTIQNLTETKENEIRLINF